MRGRIIGNLFVKILYIVSNVAGFLIVDSILNGDYKSYGSAWIEWGKLSNPLAFDYMGM